MDHGEHVKRERAAAELRAEFLAAGGRTEAFRTFETGGLRWRFPSSQTRCEAVIINTGGGVAGGDSYDIKLSLGDGANVEVTTPAAEKIYRTDHAPARMDIRLTLRPRSRLLWAPQETLLFDGCALERTLAIDLAGDAELVLVEGLVFGRLAMGEISVNGRLRDSWRIRREGTPVFADETRLDAAGPTLDRRATGNGARSFATIVVAADNIEARLPKLRAVLESGPAEVEMGASAFDHLIVVRLLSASPALLRKVLPAAMLAIVGRGAPRLWQQSCFLPSG